MIERWSVGWRPYALIALLWSRWTIPLNWLKALELVMVGLLAGRVAFVRSLDLSKDSRG